MLGAFFFSCAIKSTFHFSDEILHLILSSILHFLLQLKEASSDAMKELLDGDEYLFRFDIGIHQSSKTISTENIDHLLKLFADHYLISSVKAELDQLLSGMGALDVINLFRSNPNKMKRLLIYEPEVLTMDKMMKLFWK